MRIAALIAVSLLVAGCSHAGGGQAGQAQSSQPSAGTSSATTGPSGGNTSAPAAGAAISAVIAWIEAGHPADPDRYHAVTRDPNTTQLPSHLALTTHPPTA